MKRKKRVREMYFEFREREGPTPLRIIRKDRL
jgi:hypothetical protein